MSQNQTEINEEVEYIIPVVRARPNRTEPVNDVEPVKPQIQKKKQDAVVVRDGAMGRWFYRTFIRENILSNTIRKRIDSLLSDDEDFIEYYVIGIIDPSDTAVTYSELWMLDVLEESNKYLFHYVSNINTSSAYALSRCAMDREDYEDDYIEFTYDKIKEMCPNERAWKTIKTLLDY
jgi:hypothetical protein